MHHPTSLGEGLYDLDACLGQGGTATIYRAKSTETGKLFAAKILIVSPDQNQSHLMREIFLLSRLQHPNVIRIHDFGFDAQLQRPYIITDLLQGVVLSQWISSYGGMDVQMALHLFKGVVEGLAHGHSQKIVHRDIKPANLFLVEDSKEPRLVILDFGISGLDQTTTDTVEATPQYAPPEYLESKRISAVGDVYQLGLTLCEMITGKKVVPTQNVHDALVYHLRGVEIPPDLPPHVALLIKKMLARDPSARFQNCNEVLQALHNLPEYNDPPPLEISIPFSSNAIRVRDPDPHTPDNPPPLSHSTKSTPNDTHTAPSDSVPTPSTKRSTLLKAWFFGALCGATCMLPLTPYCG